MKFAELAEPVLKHKYANQLGLGLLMLFCLLSVFELATCVWSWHQDYQLVHATPTKTVSSTIVISASNGDVAQYHLFGAGADNLPVTSLQMQLTGIMQDPDSHQSRVIISTAGGSGKIFQIGDQLTSSLKIKSINSDGIVLEHNSRLEKLPMTRNKLIFDEAPKSIW